MISVLSSSPPGAPRSRMTARSIARPAYMPAVMPAGPAPMITTSYSCVFAISSLVDLPSMNVWRLVPVPASDVQHVQRAVAMGDRSDEHVRAGALRHPRDERISLQHRPRVEHPN